MKVLKNGVNVVEYLEQDLDSVYRFFNADLYICETCGTKVISGWSNPTYPQTMTDEEYKNRITDPVLLRFA